MTEHNTLIAIAVMAVIISGTRFFPFIVFGKGKKPPKIIMYLGKYLPPVIIVAITVYCFKDINFLIMPYGLKEVVSVLTVVLLHIKFKNTMLSITLGTIVYMLLIRLFA